MVKLGVSVDHIATIREARKVPIATLTKRNVTSMAGTLYVVATPLGNLGDLSARAVAVLGEVDLIACEDTRHFRRLLNHLGLKTSTTSYHEHNEQTKSSELLGRVLKGQNLALVSKAGTPLVSDPGYRLVRLCRENQVSVSPVPGPAAAVSALSVSGLPSDCFHFLGFLRRQREAQRKQLKSVAAFDATLIMYLSPHRLLPTLETVLEVLGNREALVAREMTKAHETFHFGSLEKILAELRVEEVRGEYTLLLSGAGFETPPKPRIDISAYVSGLMVLREMSRVAAVKTAAAELELPRQQVYRTCFASSAEGKSD